LPQQSLDIILPCYNPPPGWYDAVIAATEKIHAALPGTSLQIILVNDGSERGLAEEHLRQLQEHLPSFRYIASSPNMGKGFALRKGAEAADSDFQIYTDVDFPYQEQSLLRVYATLLEGHCDVVAGVRDASYYKNVPAARRRISRLLRWMLRTFLRLQITDTQCGLKGFNRRGRALFLRTTINRFLFDLEFIFLASNDPDIRLCPAEVELKPDIVFSRVNPRILLNEAFNFMKIFFRGIRKRFFG
jgi:glycosyltransferase involved in cell wall biosynthesis